MSKQIRFIVPVEIEVLAKSAAEAESEVLSLIQYAFEVSNDAGRYTNYRLHETSGTIQAMPS